MADYHDLVQALTWLLINKLQSKAEYTRGLLGDGQGRVQVPDRLDYTYVRPDRFSTRVYEVFNKMVSGPDGLPVVLGELPWQPGLTQVLSVDWDTYLGVGWGDATPGLPRHGATHVWRDGAPGYDAFNVYRRQMGDLRTYPVGSGSASIYVSPYNFTHMESVKSWGGLPGLDLSGAVPAGTGTARMALVYWDPCSGTSGYLGVATGTLGVDAEPEILNRPAAPAGTIPSAWVRLAGGQGSITEYDIWDARPLWTPSLKFATGSCGIWAGIIPIGDPGNNFTGSTVEAALEELADGAGGGGDVSGPGGGSTDEAIARWDGVGGDTLQNSAVTIDDSGNMQMADAQLRRPEIRDYAETTVKADSGANYTLNMENGNVFDIQLTANCTFVFSNPPTAGIAGSFSLLLHQGTGSTYTTTWPTGTVRWAGGTPPTLSTGTNDIDILTFMTVTAGAVWYGFLAGADFS